MELLSPAGSPEKMRYALHYGADAVYAGGDRFSLRTRADNFIPANLPAAVRACHEAGKRFYLAVNALVPERELPLLREYLQEVLPAAPDALIVSDPGVIAEVRRLSDIPLHLSTQMSTCNASAFPLYRELGVTRIILARELALADIAAIRERAGDMELEVFVHGALCVAWSGRCLLSHYLTHPAFLGTGETAEATTSRPRSANRGDCSHSCRWLFSLHEARRGGVVLDVEPGEGETLLFSSKDLCLVGHLRELAAAGVDALKIEGRMKSILYTAVTARVYRDALELARRGENPGPERLASWLAELSRLTDREYTTGFLFDRNDAHLDRVVRESAPARFLGVVEAAVGGGWRCRSRNRIDPDTPLSVLGPGMRTLRDFPFRLLDGKGRPLAFVPHSTRFVLEAAAPLAPLDILVCEQAARKT